MSEQAEQMQARARKWQGILAGRQRKVLVAVLFPGFELLDLCGPLEMFGSLRGWIRIVTVAQRKGPVESTQGPSIVASYDFEDCPRPDLLLVPGGAGTSMESENEVMLKWLAARAAEAETVMTVCTGSALLARTGALDGHRATTNKAAFTRLAQQAPGVQWVKEARWVDSGKFVTASGVAAGIDMALFVISRLTDSELSEVVAAFTEYEWHRNSAWDPFARIHGLV